MSKLPPLAKLLSPDLITAIQNQYQRGGEMSPDAISLLLGHIAALSRNHHIVCDAAQDVIAGRKSGYDSHMYLAIAALEDMLKEYAVTVERLDE